ncbi:MAG: hypothetical protein JXQ67_07885 [Campylobacterales bacterium]|nr:hypothetical protein [Campylobacterales bacterium]
MTPLSIDLKSTQALYNPAAYVTAQCYTKTVDEHNVSHNPCFACHINSMAPNYIDDPDLQTVYDMREFTKKNKFANLFKDRSDYIESLSDESILAYVQADNYKNSNGNIALREKLKKLPDAWDVNGDGAWNGYLPDCQFNFDAQGFDRDANESYTGWRAFAYAPFLGTFWPTNGSFDDVLIRLPNSMQQDSNGTFSLEVYTINLAIVEALIKREDIAIDEVDERKYGVDLNRDGILNTSSFIKYEWIKPSYSTQTRKITNFSMSYVGEAKALLEDNALLIAPGLYPEGTEFLHSVRYLNVENGKVSMAARLKELRYAKKESWNSYAQMQNAAMAEIMEKDLFPDRLREIDGDSEKGLKTGLGWRYQGFIEDANGALRPQSYEETLFCIGCHSGVGAIEDSTFAFGRKLDTSTQQMGWYHWSQSAEGFKGMKEPLDKSGEYEYSRYLRVNRAGDEFRANEEVKEKFFTNGVLENSKLDALHDDISLLMIPSKERALLLNKAYKVIVEEQSYIYGREAHTKPLDQSVHREIVPQTPTQNEMLLN